MGKSAPYVSVRVLAFAMLAAFGCSGATNRMTAPVDDAAPGNGGGEDKVTFTQVYENVIAPVCKPCHSNDIGVSQGGLDMSTKSTAFANLVLVPSAGERCAGVGTRVVPGEPDSSIMYLKISTDDPSPCGEKMPFQRGSLTQDQADLVEHWIDKGAKND